MAAADDVLRVAIVDDEAPARNRIRDLLGDCAEKLPLAIVGEAANGVRALELLARVETDVALLDIRMPEMDGLELAQHLRKLPQPPAVIFTTAYDVHAIRAFELHAIDYLLKPIRAERLHDALIRARGARPAHADVLRDIRQAPRTRLSVQERGGIQLVPVDEIIYLKAELKYVTVRTAAREYLIEESLVRLEQEMGERFVRIHRNCLVARAAIRGFERAADQNGEARWVVLLNGLGEKLPVSRRQQAIVREFAHGR